MQFKRIATENPDIDQWVLLSQFTYQTNIKRYLQDHGLATAGQPEEYIAGCIRQGEAYFTAAKNSPLDISPLLFYYGAVSLLAGASALIRGQHLPIKAHGMQLREPNSNGFRIADAVIVPNNPGHGALQQFANVFSDGCDLVSGGQWILEEILGSIPDLKQDFETCYPTALPYVVPVEVIERERDDLVQQRRKIDITLERIEPNELARYPDCQDALKQIAGLADAYLEPQITSKYIVLYPKLQGEGIGIYSIFGRKYLKIAHTKNGQLLSPDELIIMFMGMFALGYLSRYHPAHWNYFVNSDQTGERLILQKFLMICRRHFPNLILNALQGTHIQFAWDAQSLMG